MSVLGRFRPSNNKNDVPREQSNIAFCRWRLVSNPVVEGGSKFDLRKKEKNATKHAAQKVASSEESRFEWHCIL